MQTMPFDGVVFHLSGPGNFIWQMWGGGTFAPEDFRQDRENLQATHFGRLTHNFLRLNVTPGSVDWFDDAAWQQVLGNCRIAARMAQASQCAGLLLDTEQYQTELFNPATFPHRTLPELRRQVRQRGQSWIRTINAEFPDVELLLTFAYQVAHPREQAAGTVNEYALLPDFLDGILEACTAQTVVIDGWEHAYGYREAKQFSQARQTMQNTALKWTGVPEAYRRHVRSGFGLWMDYNLKDHGWHPEDVSRNYFTPEAFQNSLQAALRFTDRYVWIYNEQPRWWTQERLPDAYIKAVRAARQSLNPNIPSGQ
jgi:hypothetical protein